MPLETWEDLESAYIYLIHTKVRLILETIKRSKKEKKKLTYGKISVMLGWPRGFMP